MISNNCDDTTRGENDRRGGDEEESGIAHFKFKNKYTPLSALTVGPLF